MNYKDLLVTTMEPMNKALGRLGITVLNFNSGQTYNRPNVVEIEIFCELTDEEKFVFSEVRKTLKEYDLQIFDISMRHGTPNYFVNIKCLG